MGSSVHAHMCPHPCVCTHVCAWGMSRWRNKRVWQTSVIYHRQQLPVSSFQPQGWYDLQYTGDPRMQRRSISSFQGLQGWFLRYSLTSSGFQIRPPPLHPPFLQRSSFYWLGAEPRNLHFKQAPPTKSFQYRLHLGY